MSHSHKDNVFGVRLAKDLRVAFGEEDAVWYDASGGLRAGDAFWQVIEREVTSRPIFLPVLSPAAVQSKAVHMEIDMAINQSTGPGQRLLIPVLHESCEIRPSLRTLQREDFRPPRRYDDALNDLVQRIHAWILDSEEQEASTTQPASRDTQPVEQWTPQQRKLREVVRLECRRNLVKVKGAWWSVHYQPPLEGGTEEMAFEMRLRISRLPTPNWILRSLTDDSVLDAFSIEEIEALHELDDNLRRFEQLQSALVAQFESPDARALVATHARWTLSARGGASVYRADISRRFILFNAGTQALFTDWDGLCNQALQKDNPIRSGDAPQAQ